MNTNTPPLTSSPAPLNRRLWSSFYEMALLFGLVFIALLVFNLVLVMIKIQVPAGVHSVILYLVMGGYVTYCWMHGGQTLAQRTWRIQTISQDGRPLSRLQAWWRYTLAYLGIAPSLLLVSMALHSGLVHSLAGGFVLLIVCGLVNWLALLGTALLSPQKIALHERLSRSRTVMATTQR